jgi:hypothetical protein
MPKSAAKPRFRVGEWVVLLMGEDRMDAQVIEDRGRLGIDGERVYAISVPFEEGTVQEHEAAESRLAPAG